MSSIDADTAAPLLYDEVLALRTSLSLSEWRLAAVKVLTERIHGHGADTMAGEVDRLRSIITRIASLLIEPTVVPSRASLAQAQARLDAVERVLVARAPKSYQGELPQQIRFAAKHGQLMHELKCEDCRVGDHYNCAFNRHSYPRCCCPEALDLNR